METPGVTRTPRRTLRDWLVDTLLFLFAAVLGIVTAAERLGMPDPVTPVLFGLDQLVGVLGCGALWLRRRWPVELALVLVVLSAFSELVGGAMLVALFTVAAHRPVRTTMTIFGLSIFTALVFALVRQGPGETRETLFLLAVALQTAATGWGMLVHHRRRLLETLKETAVRAEAEAQQRVREAIAREIHDVLGHRLSLLSVHAGALEFNPDASPDDVSRAATVIRQSAHQALQDLREVIGVLRAPVEELSRASLDRIRELVAESRRAGMTVHLTMDLDGGAVPGRAGHTGYRIVQEGLTNARKHAPGAEVSVRVSGTEGEWLAIEVRNSVAAPSSPGGTPGQGLAGLAERVQPVGGRLKYGPDGDDAWLLSAWLPWPP
ncbi:sensor histidine kinase [Herbidospora yilanensis]|uniref:sensor histidine kinase n=1 Tax=Herbidospora yilanensis TaxID=354426 RepID=UPI0007818A8E|nr:histidine kinase [Herbidospora yilanensis]